MTNPFQEKAKEILAPLFNPEPHPFQEEWSDAHSMSSEQLVDKLASALQDQWNEALTKAVEAIELHPTYVFKLNGYEALCELSKICCDLKRNKL